MSPVLLQAVDDVLTIQAVDIDTGALVHLGTRRMPAKVQYAWRHPVLPLLYVACSAAGPRVASAFNTVATLRLSAEGGMEPAGPARPLPRRAVHLCTDPAGTLLLAAHNFGGGGMSVFPLDADGLPGEPVPQGERPDFGIYPHQVRVFPSGRTALIVDRGINATADAPERPGALRSYAITGGRMTDRQVVAPEGGYGFGPRHVDFHPTRPWLYASDERFNRLMMFETTEDRLDAVPRHSLSLLERPDAPAPRQLGGAIHVHPRGHVVYAANRADGTRDEAGTPVFDTGENAIAVFAIDGQTGEPRLLQHAPLDGFHARTFSADPSGRLLVAASIKALNRWAEGRLQRVPARLTMLRIAPDGTLSPLRSHDVETPGTALQYWSVLTTL